jgi:hypothetical protein
MNSSLRITRAGRIYESDVQVKLWAVLGLGLASLILLRAFRQVHQRSLLVVIGVLMLLVGFPAAWFLWNMGTLDIPGISPNTLNIVLKVLGGLLFAQAALAVVYLGLLVTPGQPASPTFESNPVWSRVQQIGIMLWALVAVVSGLILAVMTDVIELPVEHPNPGELLFVTTFDDFNNEWDIQRGRDSMLVDNSQILGVEDAQVTGDTLVVTYGSPYTGQIVWSTLDRKFNDLDLRVTARRVSGPLDNQYGVVFRYRDPDNFYFFQISSDGYYSLQKAKDGEREFISEWNTSDAIHQGDVANDLRIVARGDEFRFYVNGEPMPLCLKGDNAFSMWNVPTGECVTDDLTYIYQDSDFEQGRIALEAGSSSDTTSEVIVAFDNLVIIGPDSEVMDQ